MSVVLCLDAEWRPLRIESWQDAICDVIFGKSEVIEYSRDKTIRGASQTFPMPSVIRLLRRFKREKIRIKFSRLNVYARDRFTCQYCWRRFVSEELTFDHVVPRARGGKTTWENIVTACVECNAKKQDKTVAEAGMRLKTKPRKPSYLPVLTVLTPMSRVPPEWIPYWTVELSRD